jgi:hypothetical protein
MLRCFIACCVAASGLVGCASMPAFDAPVTTAGAPTVADVIAKIECEVAQARYARENNSPEFLAYLNNTLNLADFSQWAASVTVSLTVNDTAGLTPTTGLTLAYVNPLTAPDTSFAFSASPVLYQQRQRIFTQTYTLDLKSLTLNACERFEGTPPRINIAGDLGLKDQIYMGLHAFHPGDASDYTTGGTNPAANSVPDNFGATASFDVFKGVDNVGPTWTLQHFIGPTGGAGYVRDDLDKVAITFVPVAYGKPTKLTHRLAQATYTSRSRSFAAAVGRAQAANQQLVTTQAIQQLGQILSNRP